MRKITSFFLLMGLLVSCNKDPLDNPLLFQQFDADDLSYIQYEGDSLSFDGNIISTEDSLQYLLNGTDTVWAFVYTLIYAEPPYYPYYVKEDLIGSTCIYFLGRGGFEWAQIDIRKYANGRSADKVFSVMRTYRDFFYYEMLYYPESDNPTFDTATVSGTIYDDVIKFEASEEDVLLTGIKSVWFAKDHGFLRVESDRGRTIELLP